MKPKGKPAAAAENDMPMRSADFDRVMRGAFGASSAPPPPAKPVRKRKAPSKPRDRP